MNRRVRRTRRIKRSPLSQMIIRFKRKILYPFLFCLMICFIAVITNYPSSTSSSSSVASSITTLNTPSDQSSESLGEGGGGREDSCSIRVYGMVAGVLQLEVDTVNNPSSIWLMVDNPKVNSQLQKNGIRLTPYDRFTQFLNPKEVGQLSAAIFQIYGNSSRVFFFPGSSTDVDSDRVPICIDDFVSQRNQKKKVRN